MPFHDDEYDDGRSGGLVAKQGAGDNAAPLSISEISAILKRTVEERFGFVRLRGELSGVKRAASGHLYCALKDDKAVIDGVMWRGGAQRLAFRPEDGIEVIATGKLTTYPGRSKYQIVIETMEIAGEGALLALLEKLRARLAAEGLFAPERKRALPFLPGVIGVVTSPTGAVIRDILHRLADRFPSRVLVWPVLVQGEGAAQQVANAVRGFSAIAPGGPVPRPDVVIVARGGGSIEDLWSFNEEVVVRAVAESAIPVISAVGHETDTTLCDYAADRRAPTPTAAAEIAVPVRGELMAQLDELALRKRRSIVRPIMLGRERLEARVQRLPRPEAILAAKAQKLDELSDRLRRGLQDQERTKRERLGHTAAKLSLPLLRQRVASSAERLERAGLTQRLLARRWTSARDAFAPVERVLPQLNPRLPLQRGYALVTTPDGQALTSRERAAQEAVLVLEFRDGKLPVTTGSGAEEHGPLPTPPLPPRKPARPKAQESRQGDLF
ncbi:exodeoxyribonuclease VII large subunit [Novosphingobium naphthalenivorans]|uniref:exodeoxyribonuclease VII large subunit n=1 Tax=Novosphingobium naphthalenivorans TaxID=273168 RepID=UPI00082FC8DE|nr:exodeoxyribonuclease VII large subunit [Novosphingobium naphthalenivorans]